MHVIPRNAVKSTFSSLRKCKISFFSQARAVDLVCCAWTPSDGGVQHLFFYKFLPDQASSNKWRSLFRRNAGKRSAKCSACEGFAGKRSATSYAGALFAAEWAFAALILNFIYDPGRILLKQFWDRNLAPHTYHDMWKPGLVAAASQQRLPGIPS